MPNKSSPHGGFICEGTVSHGTLRTQDLLRAFADEYARVLPFNSNDACHDARTAADDLDSNEASPLHLETAQDALDRLMDALNAVAAREGMYFGNTEGDGSDFGFWRIEEQE